MKLIMNRRSSLLNTTALVALITVTPIAAVNAQDELPHDNAGLVIIMPVGDNEEIATEARPNEGGFNINFNGEPITEDSTLEDKMRQADLQLAAAELGVKFDGLTIKPRLNLEILGSGGPYVGGDLIEVQSRLNYPAFVTRADVRIVDLASGRIIDVVSIPPNGSVSILLPTGGDMGLIHRVYDSRGRYDETHIVELTGRVQSPLNADVEEGYDNTARRSINVKGGAVTVYGEDVAPGTVVATLGETVKADASGRFAIQRIMPAGLYYVDVDLSGSQNASISRRIEIPRSEWFYIGYAEATLGVRTGGAGDTTETYHSANIGAYARGTTQGGVNITAALNTGEGRLDEIFTEILTDDPRGILKRIDPEDTYPVWGDDSSSEETAPTSGKIYVKVEKDGNHLMWGDFNSSLTGSAYVRNERDLYGAHGIWSAAGTTSQGEARASAEAFAALPSSLVGRDAFLGTGGSVYFLQRQDVVPFSETVTLQVRDPDTGRILETRQLTPQADYSMSFIQGIITLATPLTGSQGGGLINSGDNDEVYLIVQYEYVPTGADVEDYSYGGRTEAWVSDNVRVGLSGTRDETAAGDHQIVAADALMTVGNNSYIRVDYAESTGTAVAGSVSTDAGLIIDNLDGAVGDGSAYTIEANLDFGDMGISNGDGNLTGYYEQRNEGFSSLDYNVLAATGNETLWGLGVNMAVSEGVSLRFSYDDYENEAGDFKQQAVAGVDARLSDTVDVELEVENLRRPAGARTDVAGKITGQLGERTALYLQGQYTIEDSGLGENNRIAIGGEVGLSKGWTAEGEISDGSNGMGGEIRFARSGEGGSSTYFGYEFGADVAGGYTGGRYLAGTQRDLTRNVSIFAENTYSLGDTGVNLTGAYGVEYRPSDYWTYDLAYEFGDVSDDLNGDVSRHAVSVGAHFEDADTTGHGRLEYRNDRGAGRDADTIVLAGSLTQKIDEARRVSLSFDVIHTDTDESTILDGAYIDANIGYAFRPVDNDRFNLLVRYRYLYDEYGQNIDGTEDTGPRQHSHVLSIDGNYDLDEHWTIGAKLGVRIGETSPDAVSGFTENNAWLGVINARYHLTHAWDGLLEVRTLNNTTHDTSEFGALAALYRHFGNNAKLGVGYNFGNFSDNLNDLTFDDQGLFVNVIAKF